MIEVKLRANAEARRAVVAQVLTYAACLRGLGVDQFNDLMAGSLAKQGFITVADAAAAGDQTGGFDAERFHHDLGQSLESGSFRLVIVLDEAPPELVRLVGYLESVAAGLTIDLICVSQYSVGDNSVVVPQRIDPDRAEEPTQAKVSAPRPDAGYIVNGPDDFIERVKSSPADERDRLQGMVDWALQLQNLGLCNLATYHGKGDKRLTLLPRLQPENVGLVTIWNEGGVGYLQMWKSVFERRAPRNLPLVEGMLGVAVGQGSTTRNVTPELLALLTDAYREAKERREM